MDGKVARTVAGGLVASGLVAAALHLHGTRGREGSFTVLAGFAFGAILQRSRFCFASAFRDLFLLRDRRMTLGVIAALAVGSIGYTIVFGAQIPDPVGITYAHATAHIGPVGWHLVLGGLSFGFGMVIAGGCISGNLYRLGEGLLTSTTVLAGILVGFIAGFMAWNWLWINAVAKAPVIWLPANLGYGGALALQLALFAAAAIALLKYFPGLPPRPAPAVTLPVAARKVFVDGWPSWLGGAAIGILATFAFFRTSPLGVTSEVGRLARGIGNGLGVIPARLEGLDLMKGCRAGDMTSTISENGIFVLALIAGSLCAALLAGEFKPRVGRPKGHLLGLGGGVLMGFGAMISIGCTVGTMLSGVMAFALSGWVFMAALLLGAWLGGLALRRIS